MLTYFILTSPMRYLMTCRAGYIGLVAAACSRFVDAAAASDFTSSRTHLNKSRYLADSEFSTLSQAFKSEYFIGDSLSEYSMFLCI